jgi:hypothetical protein
MADLERTGQTQEDEGAYSTAPPPPPPPGAKPRASGTSIQDLQSRQAAAMGTTGYTQPVSPPWVPEFLSFLDIEKALHRKALIGIFGVMIVGGLVLAVWALGKAGKDARFNAVAEEIDATLVGKPERNDIRRRRRRDIEAYDIKYQFTVDGKKYTGEESEVRADDLPGDPSMSYDGQDENIIVYYDPNNPANNRVDLPSTAFDYVLCAVGVLCMPVGAFGGWRVWRYDRYASAMGT